jgi:uncharacterized protein GlcG (DUF336 family)
MSATGLRRMLSVLLFVLLAGCGGGGGGDGGTPGASGGCTGSCFATPTALSTDEVGRILSQAVAEAQARGANATIAVVDRVGNVLAVFSMGGAAATFNISGGRGVSGGLEGVNVLPATFAAISKALTGAYLSSEGNAFTTRTAGQIVQQNFNPGETGQPGGPLFGVQFSQLSCSDLMRRQADGSIGPKRSPLGLAADPGGLPLYKNGTVVGGIGVIADGTYGIDLDINDIDAALDELIAVAGSSGFAAPADRRADRITADGRTLRFVDSEALLSNPAAAPAFASINGTAGTLVAVAGYAAAALAAGEAYGTPASGYRPDTQPELAALGAYVLVDGANANRFAPRAGTDGLLAQPEVVALLAEALRVANRTRAQIRRPLGSPAQVTISIVDTAGEVLGLVRTADAPVFGTDVSLQKARTALLFSHPNTATDLAALPDAAYLAPNPASPIGAYVTQLRAFVANPAALSDGVAYSNRAVGNLARPFFPDGINGSASGPLSKPFAQWSPFTVGLQLDLSFNNIVAAATGSAVVGCTGLPRAQNGIQIFPGSVPIYRGAALVGAIGISGDGVDQDDMIAFLGVANAGTRLATGIGNAPAGIRADTIVPGAAGTRLRYVQCPVAPFLDTSATNVCDGL